MSENPDFGERLRAYHDELGSDGSRSAATGRLLGIPAERVNAAVKEFLFLRARPGEIIIAVANANPSAASRLRTLDVHESILELAELLVRLGNRHESVLELLGEEPQDSALAARAGIIRGWAHLQAGNRSRAADLFDAGTRSAALDRPGQVLLARGLFQLVAEEIPGWEKPNPLQRARLLTARRLFAGALNEPGLRLAAVNGFVLSSLALDMREPHLIGLAQRAFADATGSAELAVCLAILHELEGRKDLARPYWQAAARNTQSAPMRARILDALRRNREPREP